MPALDRLAAAVRAAAREAGAQVFDTGVPCRNGHLSPRYVSDGKCARCRSEHDAPRREATRQEANDRTAAWRRTNPERARALVAAWTVVNRERKRRVDREYGAARSEERTRRVKAWYKANPEAKRAHGERRRALLKSAAGSHTRHDIKDIRRLQRGRCANVGCRHALARDYHIDHILPLKLGGGNGRRNLQLLCAKCNRAKAAKHPLDFAREQGALI
jgi:5-methylcytosine-specific restriction endonuclease McrA